LLLVRPAPVLGPFSCRYLRKPALFFLRRLKTQKASVNETEAYHEQTAPANWISVSAWDDTYQMPLYSGVWIDNQYVGGTDTYYRAPRGEHTVAVESYVYDPWAGWRSFNRFTHNENTNYNNPMTLTITKDTSITAHYN
jgi:hypothetical protein